jgi:hypothetical protein
MNGKGSDMLPLDRPNVVFLNVFSFLLSLPLFHFEVLAPHGGQYFTPTSLS